jgi:tungstate transport system ATP-binding protein
LSALLEINALSLRRGGREILSVDHLALEEGKVLAVIGPNGSGKSTLLLCLARLIQPDGGEILFRGRLLADLNGLSYRRKIGLVLQDPLLLDTSVYNNIAAGLRFRRLPRQEIEQRTDAWLARLGIIHLSQRSARSLSGGEAQRASLARAFALQPEILLLDEPFSALDAPTRIRLLEDLQTLLRATSITTVFVTHDLDEALALGNRVAVLLSGRMRQVGPPEEVYTAPGDEEVAAFVGVETVIAGVITAAQEGLLTVEAKGHKLEAVGELPAGRPVYFCLRPEDVTLLPGERLPATSARNRLTGRIQLLLPQGLLVRVVMDCGFPLVALVTRASAREMGLAEGMSVTAAFKASAVHLIPR